MMTYEMTREAIETFMKGLSYPDPEPSKISIYFDKEAKLYICPKCSEQFKKFKNTNKCPKCNKQFTSKTAVIIKI